MSPYILVRLQSQLQLTPKQMEQIKPLVERHAADLDFGRYETKERVSDRIDETESQIAEILTPGQKFRFSEMKAEYRAHMLRAFGAPPSPPPN
jgi:hypothetical protein